MLENELSILAKVSPDLVPVATLWPDGKVTVNINNVPLASESEPVRTFDELKNVISIIRNAGFNSMLLELNAFPSTSEPC